MNLTSCDLIVLFTIHCLKRHCPLTVNLSAVTVFYIYILMVMWSNAFVNTSIAALDNTPNSPRR